MVIFLRTKLLFMLLISLFIGMGCGETPSTSGGSPKNQMPPKKQPGDPGNETPKTPENPPHETPPSEQPVYQADPARLNLVSFERFKEKGKLIVDAFTNAPNYGALGRFFDSPSAHAQKLIVGDKMEALKPVISPLPLKDLKARYNELRKRSFRGFFGPKSNNHVELEEVDGLLELSSKEKGVLDDVLNDIKDQLFANGKIRTEFVPYILNGLSTDITLESLYEGKSAELIAKIHRALLSSAISNLFQTTAAEKELELQELYKTYFDEQSAIMLAAKRASIAQKYLLPKIKETFPIP